jgi:hypothetical protein
LNLILWRFKKIFSLIIGYFFPVSTMRDLHHYLW